MTRGGLVGGVFVVGVLLGSWLGFALRGEAAAAFQLLVVDVSSFALMMVVIGLLVGGLALWLDRRDRRDKRRGEEPR